jgi:hypothetical protein
MKYGLGVATLMAGAWLGLAPAQADVIWNFGAPGLTPPGVDPGASATFAPSSGGPPNPIITATGWSSTAGIGTSSVDLFVKNAGAGGEQGLGLNNDPSGEHEITGSSLVRIDFTAAKTAGAGNFTWEMNSVTPGVESWSVFGSNSATAGNGAGSTLILAGTDNLVEHTTSQLFNFYFFFNDSGSMTGAGNVLIAQVDASFVPLPGALPLFVTGLAGLGLLGWRRKQKDAVSAV